MNRFIVIPFEFNHASYYALIMCKEKSEYKEYRITVMNGDLEQLLFNNNVIKEINGSLQVNTSENELQTRLKTAIAKSLVKVLKVPLKESWPEG